MPNFLWSGKAPSGQNEAEEVTAETPTEARKILEGRGWTELRQHTTDVSDFIHQRHSLISRNRRQLTPKERLQYRQGTAPGLWANWLKSIENSAVIILLLAALLARVISDRQILDHNLWTATSATSAVLLAYLLFRYPVLRWWFRQTKRLFIKLHKARTWHRWDEVLRCLEKVVKAQQATNIGINDYSMARYRALALAGLGRFDEAVTGFQAAAEQAEAPPGLYHTSMASIYTVARQYDKALESYRAGLEEAADKSTILLDMGMYLVERFNRPQEARQLLAQAEKMQLSELAHTYLVFLRGLIAFRDKDFSAMDKCIGTALADFESRPRSKLYIYEGSILHCKGYLAVSSGALGRKNEARKYFAQAKKYLELHDLNDVIREFESHL